MTDPGCVIPGLNEYVRERMYAAPGFFDAWIRFEGDNVINDATGECGACEGCGFNSSGFSTAFSMRSFRFEPMTYTLWMSSVR